MWLFDVLVPDAALAWRSDHSMSARDDAQAIFGVFDGLTSVLGVIVGLLATATSNTIVHAVIGLAVASAASMGAGEWLADEARNTRAALIMATATLAGTCVPIVPFLLLDKTPATVVACVLVAAAAAVISEVRARYHETRARAYAETFSILLAVIALTVVVAVITGVGA